MQEGTYTTTYTWSWGDTSESVTIGYRNQSHAYSQPGQYNISVTATEDDKTFSARRSIIVLGNDTKHAYMKKWHV